MPRSATSPCIPAPRTRPTRSFSSVSSYFDRIPDISRDQDRTEKAVAELEEVVRKFPNTEYAISAKRRSTSRAIQLAGKEVDIGRWYMQKKDYTGAINRFKVVVTRYQTTRHVEEALIAASPRPI